MIKLKDSSILMFIPRFLRNDKKIKNLITAIDTALKEVLERFSSMKRMQKIAEGDLTNEEIELLLWEKHVDYFDKTLTKEQKIKHLCCRFWNKMSNIIVNHHHVFVI